MISPNRMSLSKITTNSEEAYTRYKEATTYGAARHPMRHDAECYVHPVSASARTSRHQNSNIDRTHEEMIKSLQDYLATSSDSDGEETTNEDESISFRGGGDGSSRGVRSPAVYGFASSPTAGNAGTLTFPGSPSSMASSSSRAGTTASSAQRSGRLEETRAQMAKLLGPDTVARAASPLSQEGSPAVHSPNAPRANMPFSMTPVASNNAASQFTPGLAAQQWASGSELAAESPDLRSLRSPAPAQQQLQQQEQFPYVPVEVMVVDRGTQTVSTVGVQTDPEPPFGPTMPGVYYPAGHTAPSFYRPQPQQPAAGGFFAGGGGVDYTTAAGSGARYGVDGRPYRQHFHELERTQPKDAAALRQQLDTIQHSIDMLISRYNLPPPPTA